MRAEVWEQKKHKKKAGKLKWRETERRGAKKKKKEQEFDVWEKYVRTR